MNRIRSTLRRRVIVAQWFVIALLVGALAANVAFAQSGQVTVQPGETLDVQMEPGAHLTVDCPEYANEQSWDDQPFSYDVYCGDEPADDISDPTATTAPPTATQDPGGDTGEHSEWHAASDHEHGDAPPQWVTDWSMEHFGHGVVFGGDEQTSHELDHKPNAFKGATVRQFNPDTGQYVDNGAQGFVRFHAQSNAIGRSAQYHSYELYWRDSAGNVSFWQGHVDFGDPETSRFIRVDGDPGTRPAMLVVDQVSWDAGIRTEQWYGRTNNGWDIGINFGQVSTLFEPGESANLPDLGEPTGEFGTRRLVDGTWFTEFDHPEGWYCAALNRTLDDGTSDYDEATGECGNSQHVPSYVAPTLDDDGVEAFGFNRVDFRVDESYDCPACALPN